MTDIQSLTETEAICRTSKNWKTSSTLLEKKCSLKSGMAEVTLLTFEGKKHSSVPVTGCKGYVSDEALAMAITATRPLLESTDYVTLVAVRHANNRGRT